MGTEPLFVHARTNNNFGAAPSPVDNPLFAMNLSPGLLLDARGLEMQ